MENLLGNKLKELREINDLLQREVASELEIDTPMLSKIERGERRAKKEQVYLLAKILKVDAGELLTLWLADQIMEKINGQKEAQPALSLVSEYISNKKNK